MNLFVLDKDPIKAAQLQCDKHVVKMIVESGQMLSTAHRMLDGEMTRAPSKSGKTMSKHWVHPDEAYNKVLYKAVHMNHPCTVWTMQSRANYVWHYCHFIGLCDEYSYRYEKQHKTYVDLADYLVKIPKNIPNGKLTNQPLAMKANPECINTEDVVGSYRAFYQTKQNRFKMVWSKRQIPEWFTLKDEWE